jgi:hypothetical protein
MGDIIYWTAEKVGCRPKYFQKYFINIWIELQILSSELEHYVLRFSCFWRGYM